MRSETATKVAGLVLLLVVELAVFTVLSPDFLTSSNLFNVMALDTENGIIALGMAIVIASGGIDLSVGLDPGPLLGDHGLRGPARPAGGRGRRSSAC